MSQQRATTNVDWADLQPFGGALSPHYARQRFRGGRWETFEFRPVEDLRLALNARGLHMAQAMFEGFKAHRLPEQGSGAGELALFRVEDHLARLERSLERLCLPAIDAAELRAGLIALVARDRERVPEPPLALYVRPLVFADDADLVAAPGSQATLLVLTAPVPPYFAGASGLRLRTELQYVRAFPGGTGGVKASGNYAAAMIAQRAARAEGYDEVCWLDGLERAYLEEAGAMNLFVVRAGELWTPPAGDTVLPGITRATLLQLARDRGQPAREQRVPVAASWWSEVSEVFTAGTAVGCAPIASIDHRGRALFARPQPGPLQRELNDFKEGRAADPHGWRTPC